LIKDLNDTKDRTNFCEFDLEDDYDEGASRPKITDYPGQFKVPPGHTAPYDLKLCEVYYDNAYKVQEHQERIDAIPNKMILIGTWLLTIARIMLVIMSSGMNYPLSETYSKEEKQLLKDLKGHHDLALKVW